MLPTWKKQSLGLCNLLISFSFQMFILSSTVNNIRAASWQNQQSGICAQRRLISAWAATQSDQFAWRKLGSLATHWAHSEDSDQSGRMPRLIWVLCWAHKSCQFVGFVMTHLIRCFRGSLADAHHLRKQQFGWAFCYSKISCKLPESFRTVVINYNPY